MPGKAQLRDRFAVRSFLPTIAVAIALAGCGGGSDDARQEDRVAIEGVVERINTAVADGNAAAWCDVFSPESVTETFGSPGRCRTETEKVIAGQDADRRLRIEAIAFDGADAARVRFSGAAGEANMSRVDGEWYLDLLQEVDAEPIPPEPGQSGVDQ